MTLSISRIYAVDGVETCILAQGPQEDAQGLLRAVERAAEAIGAAPAPIPFSGAAAPKTTRKKKEFEAAVAAKDEAPPALPPGVSEAFPLHPELPLDGQQVAPMAGPSPETPVGLGLLPGIVGGPYLTAPGTAVWDGNAPPAQFGSHVGLAPPPGAAPAPAAPLPPAFSPPPPPVDAHVGLRKQVYDVQAGIVHLVSAKQPGWVDSVGASLNAIVASNGGDVRTMSEDQLTAALGQIRFYEDTIRRSPGIA